nr:cation:dicarboxylase symporter family transporter [Desulfobacterales bacterium]
MTTADNTPPEKRFATSESEKVPAVNDHEGHVVEVKPRKRMSLAAQIIVGLVLGLICGIFFGEKVAWMKLIGGLFIKLLQIAVIPYI